jgi:hypothetical protein
LFQKSNSYQSTASEKTIKKIKQFLSKNNIKIQELEKYAIEHNLNISNVNGIADVANKIIGIATGKMNEALPEEAFHIGYAILEMTNPETGMKTKTNNVNFTLMANIAIIVKTMVIGSLTINSKMEKNEFCTSLTSPSIRAMISPFRFSE